MTAAVGLAVLLALGACEKVPNAQDDTPAAAADRPDLMAALGDIDGLSTARNLIGQAGLDEALSGPAPYTMFLPSNEALKALDAETSARLTSEEGRPELVALLRYHIAPGVITRQDLLQAIESGGGKVDLANVADATLSIQRQGERIAIGTGDQAAMVIGNPVETGNGVIYEIDRLIAPQT